MGRGGLNRGAFDCSAATRRRRVPSRLALPFGVALGGHAALAALLIGLPHSLAPTSIDPPSVELVLDAAPANPAPVAASLPGGPPAEPDAAVQEAAATSLPAEPDTPPDLPEPAPPPAEPPATLALALSGLPAPEPLPEPVFPAAAVVPPPVARAPTTAAPTVPRAAARPAPRPPERTRPAQAPTETAAAPVAGTAAAALPGAADAREVDAWRAALVAWIDRNRTYPDAARRQHVQGVVQVRFLLAADGQVVEVSVQRDSGSPLLDSAALAMLRGARLPAPPAGLDPARRAVTVAIRYRLE